MAPACHRVLSSIMALTQLLPYQSADRYLPLQMSLPTLQVPILRFLIGHLSLYRMSDATYRSWVLPATADLIDIIDACDPSVSLDDSCIRQWTCSLVAMAFDLARERLPIGAMLHSLLRLERAWIGGPSRSCASSLATRHITDLAQLSLMASGSDQLQCLAVICGLLRDAQERSLPNAAISTGAHAILQFCGLRAVAFQPNSAVRKHGSQLVELLRNMVSNEQVSDQRTDPCSRSSHCLLMERAHELLNVAGLLTPVAARGRVTGETEVMAWLVAFSSSMYESDSRQTSEVRLNTCMPAMSCLPTGMFSSAHSQVPFLCLEVQDSAGRWSPLLISNTLGAVYAHATSFLYTVYLGFQPLSPLLMPLTSISSFIQNCCGLIMPCRRHLELVSLHQWSAHV